MESSNQTILTDNPAALRWLTLALSVLLGALILYAGAPNLGAEWIMGDERIYISLNPLVTGDDAGTSLLDRIGATLTTITDLYQPLPIATYAVEYELAPNNPMLSIRRTDLLIHLANALLVWALMYQLLLRFTMSTRRDAIILGCCAAGIWALHPALALTYAADMGRTHLLSAFFLLGALLLQLAEFKRDKARLPINIAIVCCVILANLSKPAPGFALIFVALEGFGRGWRQCVRLPIVYAVLIVSFGFALLALRSTEAAGFVTDTENALFGDPLSRAGFGAWMYVRDVVAPWLVTFWHPPSPQTNFANPRVWLGFAVILAPIVALVVAHRRQKYTPILALGLIIFWSALIPLLGIASSRNVASQDRYLYLPLIGIVTLLAAFASRLPRVVALRAIPAAALILCTAFAWHQRTLVNVARDTRARAAHTLSHYPNDPRVAEYLAVSSSGANLDAAEVHEGLQRAIELADAHPEAFVNDVDRAAFYRRQSFQFSLVGDINASQTYAEKAVKLDPESPKSYFRLATALRQAGNLRGALAAFVQLEAHLSEQEAELNAVWLTNYGRVLLYDVGSADAAKLRFQRVLDNPRAPAEARRLATIDLALCEVRAGDGARGRDMLVAFLQQNPQDLDAWRALGESHLRSNLWEEAKVAYAQVLVEQPTNYLALRGFHAACIRANEPTLAFQAWDQALAQVPNDERFAAFRIWSAVCAEIPGVCDEMATLPVDLQVPAVVRLARTVCLTETNKIDEALAEIDRAVSSLPLPDEPVAMSLVRAESLFERRFADEPAAAANVIRTVLLIRLGEVDEARVVADKLAPDVKAEWISRLEREFAQAGTANDK